MTMTTPPPPPAGWYPDPTGEPGQMYWDGKAWHRLTPEVPATPKAADIPATQMPAVGDIHAPPKPADTPRTPSGKTRRAALRDGMDSERVGNIVLIVGLAAVAVIVVGLGWAGLVYYQQSHHSSPSSQSASYQAGYTAGVSGTAHGFLVESGTGINGPAVAADSACGVAFTAAQILTPSLVEAEYQQGCHDALRDHPVHASQ